MKALVEAGYSGAVHLDHALDTVGSPYCVSRIFNGIHEGLSANGVGEVNHCHKAKVKGYRCLLGCR
jgi:hypothetical protein